MAVHSLRPGQSGEITFTTLESGRVEARAYYRSIDGKRGDVRARGKSKAEARRELETRLTERLTRTAQSTPESPRLFAEVAQQWVKYEELKLDGHQKARGTHDNHLGMLRRHLLPAMGTLPIEQITSEMVFRYYSAMAVGHKPLARNVKGLLSLIMDHALNLGYITGANPVRSVKSIRREKKVIFAPDVDELVTLRKAIVAYMNDTERPGPKAGPLLLDTVDMILATGERISEVLGLRFDEDIHLDADVPYCVVNGAVKEKGGPKRWEPFPKTEAGRREIPLPPFAVAIIMRRMVDNESGSPFLFSTRSGAPNGPQDVHRALRVVRDYAGLPADFVPHALRKNVGTEVAKNMSLDDAAGLLGHLKSRVTEQFYAKRELRAPDARDLLQAQYNAITAGE